MKLIDRIFGSVLIFEIDVHRDDRGEFYEWYKFTKVNSTASSMKNMVQGNFSSSKKGVVRGIHFSISPVGQEKLVTCLSGAIYDVVVDLRHASPTFGEWHPIRIEAHSNKSIFIPNGFGHAFQSLEEETKVTYLLSSEYEPNLEFGISPIDDELNISWELPVGVMSTKDKSAPSLKDALKNRTLPIMVADES
jgi:dTDP-4-dehydrorhamnose 3,5-epimerase